MKHHEFWNAQLFDIPIYVYLSFSCLIRLLPPSHLMKANYGVPYGGLGVASKMDIQKSLGEDIFPPTILLEKQKSDAEKEKQLLTFAKQHGYPLVLKPNIGFVGKGVTKLRSEKDIHEMSSSLHEDYICQPFVPGEVEFGVFYSRYRGKPSVISINRKHYPEVTGDGVHTIVELAEQHERYTPLWRSFLRFADPDEVLPKGEKRRVSFIGSHTMGCKFTDDTHLLTPQIEQATFKLFEKNPGYNHGRLDVKADTVEDFQKGNFRLIEVNGIASLPTNMFDPTLSLFQSYRIYFHHMSRLVRIANEHRKQQMKLISLPTFIQKTFQTARSINRQQDLFEKHAMKGSKSSSDNS